MTKSKKVVDLQQERTQRKNRLRIETKWRKATAPKNWHPREAGEELVGYYQRRTVKNGSYGEYTAVLIRVPCVSGVDLIRQLDGEDVQADDRCVFKGRVEWAPGKEKKVFDLFVEATLKRLSL